MRRKLFALLLLGILISLVYGFWESVTDGAIVEEGYHPECIEPTYYMVAEVRSPTLSYQCWRRYAVIDGWSSYREASAAFQGGADDSEQGGEEANAEGSDGT